MTAKSQPKDEYDEDLKTLLGMLTKDKFKPFNK
jgi:hypothetical protein